MKILGLDIATNTGWCVLEDGKLLDYGMLNIPIEMNLFQRISFFESNLTKLINSHNPDYVAIEDVLLGISGAKTLAYLGRLNGIAISCAFKKVQNKIQLIMPSEWKSKSFDGLNGNSKKVDIQISVCKHYKLIDEDELNEIIQPLSKIQDVSETYSQRIKGLSEDTKKYIAYLSRKKSGPKSDDERKAIELLISKNKSTISELKHSVDTYKSQIENVYKQVSLDIMSKCGLTCDVSDSIGIAYSLYKSLQQ